MHFVEEPGIWGALAMEGSETIKLKLRSAHIYQRSPIFIDITNWAST